MRKTLFSLATALTLSTAFVAPAQATVLLPGTTANPTAPFTGLQGTLVGSQTSTATARTFSATFNQAVYQTAAGTLDFYYQVIRTGPGSNSNNEIRSFTVSDFDSFLVDAFVNGADTDGSGPFLGVNNPALANGTPSGSTTTFGRSPDGNVITTEFGLNGLSGTENSTTYIFRTNATAFNNSGSFGIIDGSTIQGAAFVPTSAVPEPATWGMMLLGFGGVGVAMRRRRKVAMQTA
jgi:PEP-CTERM motif